MLKRFVMWLFGRTPELYINMTRVNQEECRLRRIQLEVTDDRAARQRIKDRMMQGRSCKHASWYTPNRRRRSSLYQNVVTMRLEHER